LPLRIGKKKYEHFSTAVRGVMHDKDWSKKRATRYVGGIYQRQEGSKRICSNCGMIHGTNPMCYRCMS